MSSKSKSEFRIWIIIVWTFGFDFEAANNFSRKCNVHKIYVVSICIGLPAAPSLIDAVQNIPTL